VDLRVFDAVDKRPAKCRSVRLQLVDRGGDQLGCPRVVVHQVHEPVVHLVNEDHVPGHMASMTLRFYDVKVLTTGGRPARGHRILITHLLVEPTARLSAQKHGSLQGEVLVRRTDDSPGGRRDRKPLEIRVRVNYVSGTHGQAVAAAQGNALRELLAALEEAGPPPPEDDADPPRHPA